MIGKGEATTLIDTEFLVCFASGLLRNRSPSCCENIPVRLLRYFSKGL